MESVHGTDLDRARRVRAALTDRYGTARWWRGASLSPAGDGWSVRVDVAPPCDQLPQQVDGVPVQVQCVGSTSAQPETD